MSWFGFLVLRYRCLYRHLLIGVIRFVCFCVVVSGCAVARDAASAVPCRDATCCVSTVYIRLSPRLWAGADSYRLVNHNSPLCLHTLYARESQITNTFARCSTTSPGTPLLKFLLSPESTGLCAGTASCGPSHSSAATW